MPQKVKTSLLSSALGYPIERRFPGALRWRKVEYWWKDTGEGEKNRSTGRKPLTVLYCPPQI